MPEPAFQNFFKGTSVIAGISKFNIAFSYFLVVVAILTSCIFFFSKWAINAELMGKYNMGIALESSFVFAVTIYASLMFLCLSSFCMLIALVKRNIQAKIYALAGAVSLLPLGYLWFLDIK